MSQEWCKHVGEKVLLVEGQNDCHVVLALCGAYAVPKTFGIYACGSDTQALKRINALISGAEPPVVIGLVLDADKPDVATRWQSIQDKLKQYDYALPAFPEPAGTIIEPVSEKPRLGFWLMPNNRNQGMLEDFCLEMILPKEVETANRCVQIAEAEGCSSFKEVHRSKAIVHTYLAWQDEPGKPLGQAITANSLRPNTTTAQIFVDWLTQLFR